MPRQKNSRSRGLATVVLLALNTGMRYDEIRTLRWRQVDLTRRTVTVGASKTEAGCGRTIPLDERALSALQFWGDQFPDRKPDHYVFASERYGVAGHERTPHAHDTDPTKPIRSFKEAWETAKTKADVECRFHDLRHTTTTRMFERGVPLPVVASLLGWSAATTVRMAKRYGHIGQVAQRQAVDVLTLTAPNQERAPDGTHENDPGKPEATH